ncbi:hypothetical protein CFC21_106064, partial [Triticum aestivum]
LYSVQAALANGGVTQV